LKYADDCSFAIEDFNLPLSVASIFVIFIASLLGASLPGLLSLSNHPKVVTTIKILAFAGTGVILSTSIIHLLLPAQETLSSSCLPDAWLTSYPSYAFLICLIAISLMFMGDYMITTFIMETFKKKEATVAAAASDETNTASGSSIAGPCKVHSPCKDLECGGRPLLTVTPESRLQYTAVILAEISIALHSVIIGLVLGVAPASEVAVLLIALTFHQMLEGVALGSAAVDAGLGRKAYAILVLVFSLTTPLGTAVGIAVRSSMNPNGVDVLLSQGILDAICAGMLIYLAFSEHLNAFKSQAIWLRGQGSLLVTVSCLAAFAAGVSVMAVIGVWA
jgi:zinc transporter 1/2/3